MGGTNLQTHGVRLPFNRLMTMMKMTTMMTTTTTTMMMMMVMMMVAMMMMMMMMMMMTMMTTTTMAMMMMMTSEKQKAKVKCEWRIKFQRYQLLADVSSMITPSQSHAGTMWTLKAE